MSRALDNLPEACELFKRYDPISVHIDGVEELFGGELSEGALPVLESFFLINLFGVIDVKNVEYLLDLLPAVWREFL